MNYTEQDIKNITAEACEAAREAADLFFQTKLQGQDQFACGFAWVNLYDAAGKKIRGNTKLGKTLKAAGIRQDYSGVHQLWNPSGHPAQNIDTKEHGAIAAARVFEKYGFKAYAGSRLD